MGRLSGRTVVIARAAEQAGRLRALLEAEGAAVVEVPTIAIESTRRRWRRAAGGAPATCGTGWS